MEQSPVPVLDLEHMYIMLCGPQWVLREARDTLVPSARYCDRPTFRGGGLIQFKKVPGALGISLRLGCTNSLLA